MMLSANIWYIAVILLASLFSVECWGPKPAITEETTFSEEDVTTPITTVDNDTLQISTESLCPTPNNAVDCGKGCRNDADCRSSNRKCMCDARCGLACVKIDQSCPKLPAPENGMMKINGRVYGSKALFACREEFKLVGVRMRECQSDGTWTGSNPICVNQQSSAYCESAPSIEHTVHNGSSDQESFAVGALLIYRCARGYQIQGMFVEAKCLLYNETAKWFGPDVRCDAITCHRPSQLRNGVVTTECLRYLCNIHYQCDDGFQLEGESVATCQSEGYWSPSIPPRCKPIQCIQPTNPVNGHVRVTSTSFGSVIGYSCRSGYMLVGERDRRCQPNGQWSGKEPECEAPSQIDCGSPGPLHNGWVGGNSTAMGAQVTYNCNEGTVRVGQFETATCSSNARWSHPMPKCMGPCGLPKVSQGRLANETIANLSSAAFIPHGEQLSVECNEGYEIHLSGENPRCHNGSWTHMPICAPARCKSLPPVTKYSYAVVPKNMHGSRARYACKDGYTLKGAKFSTCHYGKWTGEQHKCEIVYCKYPGSVKHGNVLLVGNMGLYDYRAYVRKVRNNRMITYKCDRGYTLANGPPGATCVNGRWRPSHLPLCVPDQHPMLTTWLTDRSVRDLSGKRNVASNHRLSSKPEPNTTRRRKRWTDIVFETSPDETSLEAAENRSSNEYILGGDIVLDEEAEAAEAIGSCGPPTYANSTVNFHYTEHTNISNTSYPVGTEITFECVMGADEVKVSWKITCHDGKWTARPYACEDEEDLLDPLLNQSCTISTKLKNVMTFFNDQSVIEDEVEFAAGTKLLFRCTDIGKYMMMGSSTRVCHRGRWTGVAPACYGLNQMHDYALEKPPTILFRHNGGAIAQTNDGKLMVLPGTILHLECLWIRKFGKPAWEVSHKRRFYTQGWTTEEGRDANLEYRLSIYHAQASDSGVYTCLTPQRHRHHVVIEVKEVYCEEIKEGADVHKNNNDLVMNTVVNFSCANENSLVGSRQLTCLPSGNWSSPVPYCTTIECPHFDQSDPNLKVAVLSRKVSGKAIFECPRGYDREGAGEAYCQDDGQWSQSAPQCRELLCETPVNPEHGVITPVKEQYMVGDTIQISCNHGYMLDGTPLVHCQSGKRWSDQIPNCIEACMYPGSTIGGILSPVKFYYRVGEVINFTCSGELTLRGSEQLECGGDGLWSGSLPQCLAL